MFLLKEFGGVSTLVEHANRNRLQPFIELQFETRVLLQVWALGLLHKTFCGIAWGDNECLLPQGPNFEKLSTFYATLVMLTKAFFTLARHIQKVGL